MHFTSHEEQRSRRQGNAGCNTGVMENDKLTTNMAVIVVLAGFTVFLVGMIEKTCKG